MERGIGASAEDYPWSCAGLSSPVGLGRVRAFIFFRVVRTRCFGYGQDFVSDHPR